MNELSVVLKTHAFLRSQQLGNQRVVRLFTDAHPTLSFYSELTPFQRFILDLGDFVMHPDLVGQLDDGETLFAVEAKGESDLIKGLAQAEIYQQGFHYSFLAADASVLGDSIISFAQQKNVGLLAVSDTVKIAHFPHALMPLRGPYRYIERQMESVIQVSSAQTYTYNVPTHYLTWAIALKSRVQYMIE